MRQKSLLAILLSFFFTTSLWASDTEVDGIWYDFYNSTMTAAVTYRGYYSSSYSNEYTGDVTIPESVAYNSKIYSVTSIGYGAFNGCSSLTSVAIPNSVTSIGSSAFCFCSGLTSVIIGNSVASIGDQAFRSCTSLTSITIPNSVTSIGGHAFHGCSSLTSVIIGNSVTSIGGNNAFGVCSSLTSIIVDSGNSMYDSRDNCNAIIETSTNTLIAGCQSTIIPNSVTSIGSAAFDGCTGLTSVTIPNSVTSIGEETFYGCSSLTSITLPNSVTSMGSYAFSGCSSLTSIIVEAGNTAYDSRDNCNAIIETSTNTLIAGCQNTTIPNSVTSIGWGAFSGCSGLTSVTIPNSVTSIGGAAFSGCSNLTSVTIPNSVTSIGSYAFDGCSGLTSVYNYAATPQAIDSDVFYNVNINTCTLYVPEESIALYQSANVWKDFGSIKAAPVSAVEQIGQNTKSQKTITNGQLLILRDGKMYNVQGQEMK